MTTNSCLTGCRKIIITSMLAKYQNISGCISIATKVVCSGKWTHETVSR